ncbi:hypothetical protein [Lysobacter gummosus]|uniref:hypothetical protein n=1 Tax=Lysobacter gummosus TaxID=262324 RepID=UPI003642D838
MRCGKGDEDRSRRCCCCRCCCCSPLKKGAGGFAFALKTPAEVRCQSRAKANPLAPFFKGGTVSRGRGVRLPHICSRMKSTNTRNFVGNCLRAG